MSVDPIHSDMLARELAADLGRGGYVLRPEESGDDQRYFDKGLVLTRPGLLQRAAQLLAGFVPANTERLAVTGVMSCALATALAQTTGIPLLLGGGGPDGISFQGESYPGMNVLLVEDVVYTGRWTLQGCEALSRSGARLLGVIALLDRDVGAAQRLADAGISLRTLFVERELLASAHGTGG